MAAYSFTIYRRGRRCGNDLTICWYVRMLIKCFANPPNAISGNTPKDTDLSPKTGSTKRCGTDESESEEEEVPTKKTKTEEATTSTNGTASNTMPPMTKKIDIGKEAAMEAEVRAAEGIKSFKEILAEKEVPAFSTWEKELHKIVYDHRYLLLTSKERKQVFEMYINERDERNGNHQK